MTDLVQRLRTDPPKHKPVIEAAREIERLTAERDMLVEILSDAVRDDDGWLSKAIQALAAVEKTK